MAKKIESKNMEPKSQVHEGKKINSKRNLYYI